MKLLTTKQEKLRRNVDLSRKTVLILQWQAIVSGYGTIKPYLEKHLEEHAQRLLKKNPEINRIVKKNFKR